MIPQRNAAFSARQKCRRKKSVTQELAATNQNRVVFFRKSASAGGIAVPSVHCIAQR